MSIAKDIKIWEEALRQAQVILASRKEEEMEYGDVQEEISGIKAELKRLRAEQKKKLAARSKRIDKAVKATQVQMMIDKATRKTKPILVTSLDHLKTICCGENGEKMEEQFEFFILLSNVIRSRKSIWYRPTWKKRPWDVRNDVDDTYQRLSDETLWTKSNIGQAINDGRFYYIP